MKWLHTIALVAITSCLALSPRLADDDFNTNIPQPSAQTPSTLELPPDIPAPLDKLKAFDGQYKQLADVAMGTVSNAIAAARAKADDKKYRSRSGKTFVSNKLPDACELCGYARCVDLAHVVPAREGGHIRHL
jgi:hypothetical protein